MGVDGRHNESNPGAGTRKEGYVNDPALAAQLKMAAANSRGTKQSHHQQSNYMNTEDADAVVLRKAPRDPLQERESANVKAWMRAKRSKDEAIEALPPFVCYNKAESVNHFPPQYFKVFNLFNVELSVYWDDRTPKGVFSGTVQPGNTMVTTSYDGHSFDFKDQKGVKAARITVSRDQRIFAIGLDMQPKGRAAAAGEEKYRELKNFADDYYNKTGQFFIAEYPPRKAYHQLLRADYVGQVYNVSSETGGHWTCESEKDCEDNTPLELEVTVASVSPRVLLMRNFLSAAEMDLVRRIAKPKQATVGDGTNALVSDVRKSDVFG